jgi:hypothetical protein
MEDGRWRCLVHPLRSPALRLDPCRPRQLAKAHPPFPTAGRRQRRRYIHNLRAEQRVPTPRYSPAPTSPIYLERNRMNEKPLKLHIVRRYRPYRTRWRRLLDRSPALRLRNAPELAKQHRSLSGRAPLVGAAKLQRANPILIKEHYAHAHRRLRAFWRKQRQRQKPDIQEARSHRPDRADHLLPELGRQPARQHQPLRPDGSHAARLAIQSKSG